MFFTPPPPVTYTLPISTYFTYFTPFTLTQQFTMPMSFAQIYPMAGQVSATMVTMITPRVMGFYFAVRISMLAATWLFGFVAKKIGRPLAGGETPIVVMGRNTGLTVPKRLPSLEPSVMRGGRRRGRGI